MLDRGSSSSSECAKTNGQPEMSRSIDDLTNEINELHAGLLELGKRLEPVMHNPEPANPEKPPLESDQRFWLSLDARTRQIKEARLFVRSLLERLEL